MALSIVRIVKLTTTEMQVLFTDDLDENIGIGNVSITSTIDSIPDTEVTYVSVENDLITIRFRPIFEGANYAVVFSSTALQPFQTVNGERLTEDGSRNAYYIVSPGEDTSEIRDRILDSITEAYDVETPTLVRDSISSIAKQMEKCSDEIDTVHSANYISVTVDDERMVRGTGPTDQFLNGGVYEVTRVGLQPAGNYRASYLNFDAARKSYFTTRTGVMINPIVETLTEDPISLQSVDVSNEEVGDDSDENNYFSGLKIKVANGPVLQLVSLFLKSGNIYYPYDVETYGYTLKDNSYDTLSASKNVNLDSREIELSVSSSLSFPTPAPGDKIYVSYIYKQLGRSIDTDSVVLSEIKTATRKSVDAIVNRFTLDYAPVVLSSDEIPTTGGVVFYNTQAIDGDEAFTTYHPAFSREIEFSTSKLPSRPGEYSVNYQTGEVYVYGEDETNKGTGSAPPAATYLYRKIYEIDLDYTYDEDTSELAVKSTRNLGGIEAKISFNYEDVFSPGTDYLVSSHVEVLNERIQNRVLSDFIVETEHSPITNVFRIFNETTGEVYSLSRFNDTSITFSGRQAPRTKTVTRERAAVLKVPQETLYVSDEFTNTSGIRILKINLENNGIMDSSGNFIGANFNSSVIFSDQSVFAGERFYDSELSPYADNTNKLVSIGEFCIDYENGIIYVAVDDEQAVDVGDISYSCKLIGTKNTHIIKANNIYKSLSTLSGNVKTYTVGDVDDQTIDTLGLESVGERFVGGNSSRLLRVGMLQSGSDGVVAAGSAYFDSNSGIFDSTYVGKTLTVGSTSDTPIEQAEIITVVNRHQVIVDANFSATGNGRDWTVTGSDKTIDLDYTIGSVKNIYLTNQISSNLAAELDGYYDINLDTFSGSTITLNDNSLLEVGDLVVVDYNYGNLYVDYVYVQDEIIVSYEYGNNSLDWSISDLLSAEDEYFVSYKYGALRDSLLANFGSLTQIPQLTNFSTNLDREMYRSIVGGTIQSFILGPTIPSIKNLVQSFTGVEPELKEMAFYNWVLGRDPLHKQALFTQGTSFDSGKYGKGLLVSDDAIVKLPAISNLRLEEGTLEMWIKPQWNGIANDATLTFDLDRDGYDIDTSNVYIGFAGSNPATMPFSLSKDDDSVIGKPYYFDDAGYSGYFIWYDAFTQKWNIQWKDSIVHEYSGTIESSGEVYDVAGIVGLDGYSINEITDITTTYTKSIEFETFIDGYEAAGYTDGISFKSGDLHYMFDMAEKEDANRVSLYKDAQGYLNLRVINNYANYDQTAKIANLSFNISGWNANEIHQVAFSWRLNSTDEKDELHLFVDGQEVPNIFKYGGFINAVGLFRDVGYETIIPIATNTIVGATDGQTTSGSNVFISAEEGVDFVEQGITIGDSLYILDATGDGTEVPNSGAAYNITGVGKYNLTVDRNFTLTLTNVSFSVNRYASSVALPLNFQDFIVVVQKPDGSETELNGLDAEEPDYDVYRRGTTQYLAINNGVEVGDAVIVRTLGLIFERCRESLFVYAQDDEIQTNSTEPTDLADVDITKVTFPKTMIESDGYIALTTTVVGPDSFVNLQGPLSGFSIPTSNTTNGRRLSVEVYGSNIDYDSAYNYITIEGQTYSGITQETLTFSDDGIYTTTEYWKYVESISISLAPIDTTRGAGTIKVREFKPITESENNGDYAEVTDYYNGTYKLEVYGSGGMPFYVENSWYDIDYTTYLQMTIDAIPNYIFIGCAFDSTGQLDGVIDGFRILNTMIGDVRVGEDASVVDHSVTEDYNSTKEMVADANTLALFNFNDATTNEASVYDRYNAGYEVGESINSYFDEAIKFSNNRPYIINNAGSVFNSDEGSIEFWVNSLDDTLNDDHYHYYIDMSTATEKTIISSNNASVVLPEKASSIDSVRLLTDFFNNQTNYYSGGSLSGVDGKTITLGTALPLQEMAVKVVYTPISSQGDRVSIYRDPDGRLNFFVKASGVEHQISVRIDWQRHTWHRIMVMWTMNSTDNEDRLRLFVDGEERGTIKYGTGLIYGTGVIYGEELVTPGTNRFIVDNIDLTDTFPRIFIGSDVFKLNGARALIDNIRFSNTERTELVKVVSTGNQDLGYIANPDFVNPSESDSFTTLLVNFNKDDSLVENFATLLSTDSGIFMWECKVIDSYDRVMGNVFLENLLRELVDKLKPAHTQVYVYFVH